MGKKCYVLTAFLKMLFCMYVMFIAVFFFFDNQSAFHHRFLIKTEYFLAVNVFLNKQTKKP